MRNSGSDNAETVAWYWDNSGNRTHDVGTKAPNNLGIYDMSGNVWEWCDWYRSYSSGAQTDQTGASAAPGFVIRGGSWYDSDQDIRCSVYRFGLNPTDRFSYLGFRLARNAE